MYCTRWFWPRCCTRFLQLKVNRHIFYNILNFLIILSSNNYKIAPESQSFSWVHLHLPLERFPLSSFLNGSAALILTADHRVHGNAFVLMFLRRHVPAHMKSNCSSHLHAVRHLQKAALIGFLSFEQTAHRMARSLSGAPARCAWTWQAADRRFWKPTPRKCSLLSAFIYV